MSGLNYLENRKEKIRWIREEFEKSLCKESVIESYDEIDVEQLRSKDDVVEAFLLGRDGDAKATIKLIDIVFRWRKNIDLHSLTDDSFPIEAHELGGLFYHSEDKNGNKILNFRVCRMKKDQKKTDLVKKFVAYWIMKHYKLYPLSKVVCLMDMTDTGIANMDLDLIKFIVTCFVQYFPSYLAYLLIFDMPWLFNAIWQVIRKMLSEQERKFVIFVTKSNIKEYIGEEQLFTHMGGKNTFQYRYERLALTPKKEFSFDSINDSNIQEDSTSKKPATKESLNSPLVENGLGIKPKKLFQSDLATINPMTDLIFQQHNKNFTRQNIEILSHSKPVAFKVKTTNPSAFKVKPSSGITKTKFKIEISVVDGVSRSEVESSRFLVMIQSIDEDIEHVSQVTNWRDNEKSRYVERQLRCKISNQKTSKPVTLEYLQKEIECLRTEQLRLKADLKKSTSFLQKTMNNIYGFFFAILCLYLLQCFRMTLSPISDHILDAFFNCSFWK